MARRQRIHVPEGTYYVVQRGSKQHPIFAHCDDYELFERLLPGALNRTGIRLHGYCWTPDAVHLALQIDEVSVGRFMQGLTSRYARAIQQRAGDSGHFFRQRYHAVLIDPARYLLSLIHYLHYIPVLAGMADSPDAYPHSSHRAYSKAVNLPWLHMRTATRILESRGNGARAYRELMAQTPEPQAGDLFHRGHRGTPGIVGSAEFLENLPRRIRPYRSKVSLGEIIENVTCTLGVQRDEVLSNSRRRELALARALIAWYATERRIVTLSEVARHLRRDPSTLSVAIARYRGCRPELFKLNAFHHLAPIGPGNYRIHGTAEAVDSAIGAPR